MTAALVPAVSPPPPHAHPQSPWTLSAVIMFGIETISIKQNTSLFSALAHHVMTVDHNFSPLLATIKIKTFYIKA